MKAIDSSVLSLTPTSDKAQERKFEWSAQTTMLPLTQEAGVFLPMNAAKQGLKYLLGVAFVLAGINHFRTPDFYIRIMPDYIPAHAFMVYLSGVTEILAGLLLLIPKTQRWGAWAIVGHLVAFFPVHIWMIQKADRFSDVPLWGLWARLAFQFVFLAWAGWYTRPDDHTLSPAES